MNENTNENSDNEDSTDSFIYVLNLFRSLGQREDVLIRIYYIMKVFEENPSHFFSRKEIERIILPKLNIDIKDFSNDFKRLLANNILTKRGLKYHLTSIGSQILFTIIRIKKEYDQHVLTQFTRSMLNKIIYEDQGLNIHSYKHVAQIGTILRQLINDIIDRDETIEWVPYLEKFDSILNDLDTYSKSFENELPIFNLLMKIKSELSLEFAKLHYAFKNSIQRNLSLISKGLFPDQIKIYLNYFGNDDWLDLESIFHPLIINQYHYSNVNQWLELLQEDYTIEPYLNKEENFKHIQMVEISKENLEIKNFLPDYLSIFQDVNNNLNSEPNLISDVITNCGFDIIKSISFIGYIPTLIEEFDLNIIAIKKLVDFNDYNIIDGIIERIGE